MERNDGLPAAPPSDIEIHVRTEEEQGHVYLTYNVHSPSGAVGLFHVTSRTGPIRDLGSYASNLFNRIERLQVGVDDDSPILSQEIPAKIAAIGHQLYHELFSQELKTAYRRFRDDVVQSILIISNEPWIPWELIKPYDDSDPADVIDDDFLCMRFQMTRWIYGALAPATTVGISKLASIIPGDIPGTSPLPSAPKERKFINKLVQSSADVESINLSDYTYESVAKLLAGENLDLLHFSGHGRLNHEQPDDSSILLEDGRSFHPRDLQGVIRANIRKNRPLIFFNASHSARQGWAFNRLAGWAASWLHAGCGIFIGPAWDIGDQMAYEFTRYFYRSLQRDESLGAATQRARRELRSLEPESLGWLAYVAYGHPNCRVSWGESALRESHRKGQEPSNGIETRGLNYSKEYSVGRQGGATNDRATGEDHLRFEDYARAFASLVESIHTEPPLTIGVFGPWGIGKSFLLNNIYTKIKEWQSNMTNKKLASREAVRVHVVEFNAWEYSANKAIWPGLVRKIMDSLEGRTAWKFPGRMQARFVRNFRRQFRENSGKLMLTIYLLVVMILVSLWSTSLDLPLLKDALIILTAGGVLKFIMELVNNPVSLWAIKLFRSEDYGRHVGYMSEIRSDLEYLERHLRPKNFIPWTKKKDDKVSDRILVIIDDLDRCEPEQAVETLQAINLLLNFDSFIVCLGIDARIIARAVEKHYKDLLGPTGASGYEYLDKIVQIPFRIPSPDEDDIANFVYNQLGKPRLIAEDGSIDTGSALPQRRTESNEEEKNKHAEPSPASTGAGGSGRIPKDMAREYSSGEAFTSHEYRAFEKLIPYLNRNPRHIKRIINVYRLVRTIAQQRGAALILDNPAATIHFLVLCAQWPFATYLMLKYLDRKLDKEGDQEESVSRSDPLKDLSISIQEMALGDSWGLLDGDFGKLIQLCSDEKLPRVDLDALEVVRNYAINFNPAVGPEEEWGTTAAPQSFNGRLPDGKENQEKSKNEPTP